MAKPKMTAEEEKFYASFKDLSPKRKPIAVGDTVRLKGKHPWAGHTGEVMSLDTVMNRAGCPKVRLHDTQDHEVYVMTRDEVEVI